MAREETVTCDRCGVMAYRGGMESDECSWLSLDRVHGLDQCWDFCRLCKFAFFAWVEAGKKEKRDV